MADSNLPPPPGDSAFRQAVEQAYNSVMITEAALAPPGPRIVYVNPAFCAQTGYGADELLGQTPRILQGPGTERPVLDRLRETIGRGDFFEGQAVNYRKDGEPYLVRWNISPLRDSAGHTTHYLSVQKDITDREQIERFNHQLLSNIEEGVIGMSRTGGLAFANRSALALLGRDDVQPLIGGDVHDLLHGNRPERCGEGAAGCSLRRALAQGVPLKGWRDTFYPGYPGYPGDGEPVAVEFFAVPLKGLAGEADGMVITFRDISRQLALETQLRVAAQRDRLTGAFNRHYFDTLIDRERARAARGDERLCLVLLDVDHFKAVNDEHGHLVGDEVLRALVNHLSGRLRRSDILIRWGGEEFALVLPATALAGARALAEGLRDSVQAGPLAAGLPTVTVSAGVTELPPDGDLERALKQADDALYVAKREGRNRVAVGPAAAPVPGATGRAR
ncbi:MAG: sensor domain-containing diguanylate cyclase [Pseudohaliea sp.]